MPHDRPTLEETGAKGDDQRAAVSPQLAAHSATPTTNKGHVEGEDPAGGSAACGAPPSMHDTLDALEANLRAESTQRWEAESRSYRAEELVALCVRELQVREDAATVCEQ